MPNARKYPLPPVLYNLCTPEKYGKWLHNKADTLRKRDLRLKRIYAQSNLRSSYKQKIHNAILDCGTKDPYTGEPLRWDLIGKWDSSPDDLFLFCSLNRNLAKECYLVPTVDHVNPLSEILEFEICSWIVNVSKNLMTPQEFLELCRKVVLHSAT